MQDNIGISFRDAVPGPDVPVKILQVNDLFADNRDNVMKMKKGRNDQIVQCLVPYHIPANFTCT